MILTRALLYFAQDSSRIYAFTFTRQEYDNLRQHQLLDQGSMSGYGLYLIAGASAVMQDLALAFLVIPVRQMALLISAQCQVP